MMQINIDAIQKFRISVLMSVQPKWCEKIASGKKTIEVRPTVPKVFRREFFAFEPFKVYIYCTQQKLNGEIILTKSEEMTDLFGYNTVTGVNKGFRKPEDVVLSGKVIGEFTCNKITPFSYDKHIGFPTPAYEGDPSFYDCGEGYWITGEELEQAQLTYDELCNYGKGKNLYGWHISDLIIYDNPKELKDFKQLRSTKFGNEPVVVERAPQSWMYVRETG